MEVRKVTSRAIAPPALENQTSMQDPSVQSKGRKGLWVLAMSIGCNCSTELDFLTIL